MSVEHHWREDDLHPIHVWGSNTREPDTDSGECIKCGLVALALQIAQDRMNPQLHLLPSCR